MQMLQIFRKRAFDRLRFKLDWEKSIEAIDYIATVKPGVTQYYIGKIMYFADKAHFLDWGRPISGDRYYAMEHGPVPSTVYDLLKEDSGEPDEMLDKLAERLDIKSEGNKRRVYSKEVGHFAHLSGSDREYLKAATLKYGKMTFGQLKALSHQEPAYTEAENSAGLNNEMNLLRWAEELRRDTDSIVEQAEEGQLFKP